jgi:hypothetical protein
MVDLTYRVSEANAWWGKSPGTLGTAVVDFESTPLGGGYLLLEKQHNVLTARVHLHPFPGYSVQKMNESPDQFWLPDDEDRDREGNDWGVPYWGSFASVHIQQRYTSGLYALHGLGDGIRHVLHGEPLQEPYNSRNRTSPYTPDGLWEYVPPTSPFDLRVRAQTTTRIVPTRDLGELALAIVNARLPDREPKLLTQLPARYRH